PEPTAAQLAGKLLYVRDVDQASLNEFFVRADKVAEVTRKRGPLLIETYALDVLEQPTDGVFDRSPPPELK
ncbi:MAG: glycosyl transferase, partial [Bradyrhizobium sp.]